MMADQTGFLTKAQTHSPAQIQGSCHALEKGAVMVPGVGVEPTLPHRKTDFKSVASAIPPSGQISSAGLYIHYLKLRPRFAMVFVDLRTGYNIKLRLRE